MKGPSQRLKYDLRRLWECPVCKRRERTAGTVTYRHCSCQMKQIEGKLVVMKLIEDGVQRITPTITIHHELPGPSPTRENQPTMPEPEPGDTAISGAAVEPRAEG